VDDFLALVRLDVLDTTFRAHVIAATAPDIRPFCPIEWAPIIIDVLLVSLILFLRTIFDNRTGARKPSLLDHGP